MTSTLENSFIPELEQEVLGAFLVSEKSAALSSHLRPEHFVEPCHRKIFASMLAARERYHTMNLAVVRSILAETDGYEAFKAALPIAPAEYLARLAAGTVRGVAGLRDTIPAMLQQSARFSLARECERVMSVAADPGVDAGELLRATGRSIDDISSMLRSGRQRQTLFSVGEAAALAVDDIAQAIQTGGGLTGTTWGLVDVDKATGGIQPGEMTIIGARPSMGKSAVALSVGIKAAMSGVGVGFISLEMAARTLAMRAMTDLVFDEGNAIAYSDLLTGRVDDSAFERVMLASQRLKQIPLRIEDAAGLSMSDIRTKFEKMNDAAEREGKPIRVLIIDYLQLIAASSRYQGNRNAEITEISAGLRNLSREFNVAVVALSQLSRQVESREDKRPQLSDLRESGSIEQDADTVIFLFREAYYLQKEKGKTADAEADRIIRLEEVSNKLEFIIAKQRNGPVRTIDLFIDVAASAVRNAARSYNG